MDLLWKPIVHWPGERTKRPQTSRFRARYSDTLALVDDELRHLRAKNIVLQADCEEADIRLDGRLRVHARLRSQGIILALDSKHGPLSWACDRYTRWEDNLRAIGLTMQALRAVSRYGVVREAEQYKGFKALPAPAATVPAPDLRAAAVWLADLVGAAAGQLVASADDYASAKRKAQALCHPDRHGGIRQQWDRLQHWVAVLDHHHAGQ